MLLTLGDELLVVAAVGVEALLVTTGAGSAGGAGSCSSLPTTLPSKMLDIVRSTSFVKAVDGRYFTNHSSPRNIYFKTCTVKVY